MNNCHELTITRQKIETQNLLICTGFGLMFLLTGIVVAWIVLFQEDSIMSSAQSSLLIHPKSTSMGGWMFLFSDLFLLSIGIYYISIWRAIFRGQASITFKKNRDEKTIHVWEHGKLLKELPIHMIYEVYIEKVSSIGVSYYLKVVDTEGNTLFSLDLAPIIKGEVAHSDRIRMVAFLRASQN